LKIVHVVSYFQPEFGYEEYFSAREQAAKGHEVHVITSDRIFPFRNVEKMLSDMGSKYKTRMRPKGEEKMEGFTVHRKGTVIETLYDFIIYKDIKEELSILRPDVVHCHIPYQWGSYQAAKVKDELGFKLVVDEHGYDTTYDQKRTFRNWLLDKEYRVVRAPLARYSLKRADAVVAKYRQTRDFLMDFYHVKDPVFIPLGIDHRKFIEDPSVRKRYRRKRGWEGKKVLVTAGRLDKAKKLEIFIEALKYIKDEEVLMVVIGQGDDDYLKKLREMSDDRVEFLGFMNSNELSEVYNGADIGFWGKASITIREAMACKLPVVLFDIPNLKDLIQWDNGLYADQDSKKIAEAFEVLLKDEEKRKKMGERGREGVKEDFSVEVEAGRLLEVYERILSGK
jgi:glycosyltransferase involved in cell wall biosynthesis